MNTIKIFVIATLAGLAAYGQTAETKLPATDAEKIADALRAGPAFVTKDATLLDWPSKPGGAYRVLRQGTGAWTCLPAVPGYPHDEPGAWVQQEYRPPEVAGHVYYEPSEYGREPDFAKRMERFREADRNSDQK